MTVAHEVSAAKEPISVAEKRQQLTSKLSRRLRYIRVIFDIFDIFDNAFFLDRIGSMANVMLQMF